MPDFARAAVFHGSGQPFHLCPFPVPVPQATEVLVQVTACTLCGSDLHSVHGRRAVPVPTVLGHEILGRIVEFGPDSPRIDQVGQMLRVGDRVTWSVVASCGACFFCERGLPQKCEHQTKYGHERIRPGYELTGGLADHCLLATGTAMLRVPEELPDAVACPANCATATIAGALRLAGEVRNCHVLVLGAGMLGVTATAWARELGAAQVICCDVEPRRLAGASQFGATALAAPEQLKSVVDELTAGRGVDVILELTGSPEAFETALPLARIGGRVVLIGSVFPTRPVPLLLEQIVRRCLTICGNHNYVPQDLQAAVNFLAQHHQKYPFASLVGEWFPLSDVERAFETSTGQGLRVGVRP